MPRRKYDDTNLLIDRESAYGKLIPYITQVSDTLIGTVNNDLIGFIALHGKNSEHLNELERNHLFLRRNQLLISDIRDNIAFHYLTIKRKNNAKGPQIHTRNTLFKHLINTVQEEIENNNYTIEHYIAIISTRSISKKIGFIEWLRTFFDSLKIADKSKVSKEKIQAGEKRIESFEKYINNIATKLSDHGARVLTTTATPGPGAQTYSEPLTLLHYLINHEVKYRPLSAFTTNLNHHLANKRLSFYKNGKGTIGNVWFGSKSIKDFPRIARDGMMDALLFIETEIILSLSYRFLNPKEASADVQKQLRVMNMVDDKALMERTQLIEATEGIETGAFSFGESCFHLLYFAQTEEKLDEHSDYLNRMFDTALITPTDDDIAIEKKFLATLPSNWNDRTRVYFGLHSGNIANIITWRNTPKGNTSNVWTDETTKKPLAWLKTVAHTPYNFNLHDSDLGNTIITGKSGSGKTVILTYLASCCIEAGARVAFIDKDRGAEIMIRAGGGQYHIIEQGTPSEFNPFAQNPTEKNIAFTTDLILSMLKSDNTQLTPAETQDITENVKSIFSGSFSKEQKNLGSIIHMLSRQSQRNIYHAMSPWIGEGQHSWLFDNNKNIDFKKQQLVGFDMTHILNDARLSGLTLRWILHQIEDMLDGSPVAIIIDEGWRALDEPNFANYIKNFAKTIRKLNGLIIFGTNNPTDLYKTEAGMELITQSPTHIFTPNDKGKPEDYKHYKLDTKKIELILEMQMNSREFLLSQSNHTAHINFDLSNRPEIIKILSGREKTVREMHTLMKQHGKHPENWLPHFHPTLKELY